MATKYVATFEVQADGAIKAMDQTAAAMQKTAQATDQVQVELAQLQTQLNSIDPNTAEYAELSTRYKELGGNMDDLTTKSGKTVAASQTLKQELKQLQARLAELIANGQETSAEFVQLSARAGQVKDAIGDASAVVKSQAGGAFENVAGSAALFQSRLTSLDFDGLAASAQGFGNQLKNIKPGDIAKGIGEIGKSFVAVGKALLTNPIFLIAAAITAAILYAKEFTTAIDGISRADEKNLELQKAKATASKNQLDSISAQENVLKLAGKSEREILDMKIKAAEQAIIDQEALVATLKTQKDAQIAAATRNRDILKGLINFISLPLTALLAGVDQVTKGLKSIGVISEETYQNIGNLQDRFTTGVAELVFDPKAIEKEGADAITAAEKTFTDLKNQQAGFKLSVQNLNKADAQKAEELRKKQLEDQKKINEEVKKLQEEQYQSTLDQYDKEARAVDLKYKTLIDQAKAAGLSTVELEKLYNAEISAINKKQADDIVAQEKALNATLKQLEVERLNELEVLEQEVANIGKTEAQIRIQAVRDEYFEKANQFEEGSTEYQALIAEGERQITEIEKAAAKEREDNQKAATEKQKADAQQKVQAIADIFNQALGALTAINNLFAQQTQQRMDELDAQLETEEQGIAEQLDLLDAQAAERLAVLEQQGGIEAEFQKRQLDAETKRKKDALNSQLNTTKKTLKDQRKILEQDAKQQFERNKKLQIAQALIQTYLGANAAFTQTTTVLGPIAGAIAAGLAVVSGLANVASIRAQKYDGGGSEGGGGGGGGVSGLSGAGAQAEAPQYNPLAALNLENRPEQQTTRTYVLAGEVVGAIDARSKIEDQARLG